MAERTQPSSPSLLPGLTVARAEAERQITARIEKGRKLLGLPIDRGDSLDKARMDRLKWDRYNRDMLRSVFDSPRHSEGYGPVYDFHEFASRPGPPSLDDLAGAYRGYVQDKIAYLESILERLHFYAEPSPATSARQSGPSAGREDNAMRSIVRPFISISFDKEDQDINDYVKGILDALRIPYLTGERWSKDSIPDKVRKRILESDFLVSIFVKRGKLQDGGHTTPSWLVKEATIAEENGMSVVAWVECGITDIAGLDFEKELIYFDRDDVKSMQKATLKFLEALREHLPQSPGAGVRGAQGAEAAREDTPIPPVGNTVVRDETGGVYYIEGTLGRHRLPNEATARFFAGRAGEVSVSTRELQRYPLTEPISTGSVRDCEILYLDPGPHIYLLLGGRTKYVGIPDLTKWGRQQETEWRHVDEQEFRGYPTWD